MKTRSTNKTKASLAALSQQVEHADQKAAEAKDHARRAKARLKSSRKALKLARKEAKHARRLAKEAQKAWARASAQVLSAPQSKGVRKPGQRKASVRRERSAAKAPKRAPGKRGGSAVSGRERAAAIGVGVPPSDSAGVPAVPGSPAALRVKTDGS